MGTQGKPKRVRWAYVAGGFLLGMAGLLGAAAQLGPCGDRSTPVIFLSLASMLAGGVLALKGLWWFLSG